MSVQQRYLPCLLVLLLTGAILLGKAASIPINGSREAGPLDDDTENYRLPENVLPTRYTLRIEPNMDPDQLTFKGEVEIEIKVLQETPKIVLHAASLDIEERRTELLHANGSKVNVPMTFALDEKTNFYKVDLNRSVPSGLYTLRMKYRGILHRDMLGFFADSYVNEKGDEVWFAATIFSPTTARRAFPCFDEPSFKATFKIFITHSDAYTAISNMPVASKTKPAGDATKWVTEFLETPKMSSFLVAFSVSDFEHLSSPDGRFRVFGRSDKIHMGEFALAMAPKALGAMANYTKIDFQLPKLDSIVIPEFPGGGLENWGLIEYRESWILYDESHTTTENKHDKAKTLSHECSHQWFGNLVSPSWWSFNWLSEGLATYFGYWITDQIEPSWRIMDEFVTKVLQEKTLTADADNVQPPMDLTERFDEPDEVMGKAFNSVTYSKASCVIRMFAHVLGPTVFQIGLQNYLKNKSYQAATSDDLVRELAAVGQDIEFLDKALVSWITQSGYPVVTVTRDYATGNATVSQRRFSTSESRVRNGQWFVPINVVTEEKPSSFSQTRPTHWLLNDTEPLTLSGLKNDSWIILNSQQTGYYRVNYDARNWQLIIDYLMNPNTLKNIDVLNRAQLLDDAFYLADGDELPDQSTFLEMTKYLQHEDDYVPWYAAHRAFKILDHFLKNTPSYDLYKLYVQRLTSKLEEKLGYTENDDETDDVKLNRLKVIEVACAMGSAKCRTATHEMLLEHVVKFNKTSADLQSVVLCAGMRSVNKEEWEEAYNYTTQMLRDTDEHRALVDALGCASDPEILKEYLGRGIFEESNIDAYRAFEAVLKGGGIGVDAIFAFIRDRFQSIMSNYGPRLVRGALNQIAGRMTNQEQMTQLRTFIDTLPAEHMELANALRDLAANEARWSIEYAINYGKAAVKFLRAQNLTEK